MNMRLDSHATAAERAEVDRLYADAKITGQRVDGVKIHDLLVSCYVADGEDGRPEEVHESKISDGSCRCGYYKPRSK